MPNERRRAPRTTRERVLAPGRAGWSIPEYFPGLCGFGGRTSFYALPEEARPRHIRVGKRIVIVEAPSAYLDRLVKLEKTRPIEFRRAA